MRWLLVLTRLIFTTCFLCYCGNSQAATEWPRKQSSDCTVAVSIDQVGAEIKGIKFPVASLSIKTNETRYAALQITNCLNFVDAKLDQQSGELAVVYYDGLCLVYQRYRSSNGAWQLEQTARLIEYNVAVESNWNRLGLQDLNTLRISFIKKGENFSKVARQRGVERPDDKVYFIQVATDGRVTINGSERKSLQWIPER